MRIVSGPDDFEPGVYSLDEAIDFANEYGVDLVEVNATANPPVCKLVNYSKFKYEQKKREKEVKKKHHVIEIKEIRMGPNTDTHDFEFKLKHAENFLKEGNKVKTVIRFFGRTIVYKERGEYLLLQFAERLNDVAKVEQFPMMDGNRMSILLMPKSMPRVKPA